MDWYRQSLTGLMVLCGALRLPDEGEEARDCFFSRPDIFDVRRLPRREIEFHAAQEHARFRERFFELGERFCFQFQEFLFFHPVRDSPALRDVSPLITTVTPIIVLVLY